MFSLVSLDGRMRIHFSPQHWLLCHVVLNLFEFEFINKKEVVIKISEKDEPSLVSK